MNWEKNTTLLLFLILPLFGFSDSVIIPTIFNKNVLTVPTTSYGSFLIDRDGFIWIGTTGLSACRYDAYELINFSDSIKGKMITSIVEDKDGVIWIASFTNGITSYNKEDGKFTSHINNPDSSNTLSSNNISFLPQKLFVDKANRLWVGTDDAGICRYDKKTDFWVIYKKSIHGLNDNAITSIIEDREGIFWIGTQSGGINRFDPISNSWGHYKRLCKYYQEVHFYESFEDKINGLRR